MKLPERQWSQTGKKQKLPFSKSIYVGCHQKVWSRFWVGLLPSQMIQLRKPFTDVPSWMGFNWFQKHLSWQSRLAISESPRTGDTKAWFWGTWHGCQELNLNPLWEWGEEREKVLLTTELSSAKKCKKYILLKQNLLQTGIDS